MDPLVCTGDCELFSDERVESIVRELRAGFQQLDEHLASLNDIDADVAQLASQWDSVFKFRDGDDTMEQNTSNIKDNKNKSASASAATKNVTAPDNKSPKSPKKSDEKYLAVKQIDDDMALVNVMSYTKADRRTETYKTKAKDHVVNYMSEFDWTMV